MLALMPASLPPRDPLDRPGVHPAQGPRRARVALLGGCAQPVLAPSINAATIRLLTRLGVEVVLPPDAGCCGSLNHHIGQRDAAMAHARDSIAAWTREIEAGGLDAIVITASGCGTTIKDYGFMFRTAPDPWPALAARVSGLAMDVTEFLTRIGYRPTRRAEGVTLAYHAACSLQHGQKITSEPKALLRQAGFRIVEPAEAHLCCGSAGTYNMLQPDIAARLRARKLARLRATGPDLIAAGNIGCITQLSGDGVPVVHTVELLDWAAGGPVPAGAAGVLSMTDR